MFPFSLSRIDLKIIDKDKSMLKFFKNKIVEFCRNIYEMVKCYLFDNQSFFYNLNLSCVEKGF